MGQGGIEVDDEDKKTLNVDAMAFLRKRSESNAPRYAARLKNYIDLRRKQRRAAAARRHSELALKNEAKREDNNNVDMAEKRENAMKMSKSRSQSRFVFYGTKILGLREKYQGQIRYLISFAASFIPSF
ncbi:hypothetical protein ACJJTC_009405 [Scirpophaga incertulas]